MILCAVVLVLSVVLWIVCRKKRSKEKEKRKIWGVVMVAAFLGLMEGIVNSKSPVLLEGEQLMRQANGEGNYAVDLGLQIDDGEDTRNYHIEVPEQVLQILLRQSFRLKNKSLY